jgi:hypothetical protein
VANGGNPITLPGTPVPQHPGDVVTGNNAGIASGSGGSLVMNPDGTLNPAAQNADGLDRVRALMGVTPPSLTDQYNSSPEKAQRDQAQRDTNNYMAQVNTIVAKSQADQLRVVGQGRGIPEAVIGGQQAQIAREAAIEALPVQALLSASQGNLQMAQSNLDTVFKLRSEDAKQQYDYKIGIINAVYDAADKSDQKKLDAVKAQNEQAYNEKQDFLKTQNQLLSSAVQQGAPGSVVQAINKATTAAEAITAAGAYGGDILDRQYKQAQISNLQQKAKQASTALPPATQTRVQGVASQFDAEPVVKEYNTIATSIDAVRNAGVTPTDDIQRIYAFAKVMDPNSVVREGEYKTVQDYATSLMQRAGIKAKRVFDNSGFLTDEARGFLLKTLENRFSSTEKSYNNIYKEYGRRIDKVTGRNDGTDYITNYSEGYNNNDDPLGINDSKAGGPDPLKIK